MSLLSIMSSSCMETMDGRTLKRSVINALRVYRDVAQMIEGKDNVVPTGVNVEQLTRSNFFLSVWMLREFGKAIDSSSAEIGNQIQTTENR